MVDNAASLPAATGNAPRKRPGKHHKRPPAPRPQGRPVNPPSIDVTAATESPVEERPADVASNATASFSTGAGGAEMYHYDRQAMTTQERTANQLGSVEVKQLKGPGQA